MSAHGSFATAINCMDGRTQLPVNEWMRRKCGADYVDTITEPGPVKLLAEARDTQVLRSIRRRVEISVTRHGSKDIAIVAHHDCAGNPVEKERQLDQLSKAAAVVDGWALGLKVYQLWVDSDWRVHEVN